MKKVQKHMNYVQSMPNYGTTHTIFHSYLPIIMTEAHVTFVPVWLKTFSEKVKKGQTNL